MVTTINRVQRNTDEAINRRIEAATGERIRRLARHPLAIERRLRESSIANGISNACSRRMPR